MFIRSVSIPDNYSPSRPAATASNGETAPAVPPTPGRGPEQDTLDLAKTYFDLKEYDRAAFFANGIQSPAGESFLKSYSMDQITIKTPNHKCRFYWCLIEFIDWRYSQSCWYFRPLL